MPQDEVISHDNPKRARRYPGAKSLAAKDMDIVTGEIEEANDNQASEPGILLRNRTYADTF